jgi:hypothetical protein
MAAIVADAGRLIFAPIRLGFCSVVGWCPDADLGGLLRFHKRRSPAEGLVEVLVRSEVEPLLRRLSTSNRPCSTCLSGP